MINATVNFDVVVKGNYYKFTKSEDAAQLKAMLLATGDRVLAEASPRDKVWGIGRGASTADANRDKWGKNQLGEALMIVRDMLKEGVTLD